MKQKTALDGISMAIYDLHIALFINYLLNHVNHSDFKCLNYFRLTNLLMVVKILVLYLTSLTLTILKLFFI